MKNASKLFTLALAVMFFASLDSFAGAKEKAVAKAKQAVENGSPDDWMLLARQADFLITRGVGLSAAKEWIEKSLSIKQDAYNLELMGDYYAASNLYDKAINYYIKSADKVKEGDPNASTIGLQQKMASAVKNR